MNPFEFLKKFKEFIKVIVFDDSSYVEKKQKIKEIESSNTISSFERKTLRLLKSMAYIGVVLIAIFSSYEAWRVYEEYCDKREAVSNLQYVSEKLYYKDGVADVSLELLKKAEVMDENNIQTKYIRSFIESMIIADRLLDLDRQYNAKELKEAQYALANAEFLIEDARRGDSSGTFRGTIYNFLGIRGSEYEADGFFARSQIYLALKDYQRAMKNINHALKLVAPKSDKNIYFEIRKATILVEIGKIDEAIQLLNHYKKILEKRDLKEKNKIFLAQVYNWIGVAKLKKLGSDSKKANEYFKKSLNIDDKFLDGLYNYTEYLVSKLKQDYTVDQIFQIEEYIQRMLRVNPEYKYAYYLWAYMYGKIDQYDIAEKYCDIALHIDSGYFDATELKARILSEKKSYQKALETIEKALSLQPKNILAHYRKGIIENLMKNYKAALKSFDYAIYFGRKDNLNIAYYALMKKAEILLKNKNFEAFPIVMKKAYDDMNHMLDYRYWFLQYDFCVKQNNSKCINESIKSLKNIQKNEEFGSKKVSEKIEQLIQENST